MLVCIIFFQYISKLTQKIMKRHCVVCALNHTLYFLILFTPIRCVRHTTKTCRFKFGSIVERRVTLFIWLCDCAILLWDAYLIPEYCSENDKLRCLVEITDIINFIICISSLRTVTTKYVPLIKSVNLMADLVDSAGERNGRNVINAKWAMRSSIILLSIHLGFVSTLTISCLFSFYNTKSVYLHQQFLTLAKFLNTLFQIMVYVFYTYFSVIIKYITEDLNNLFYTNMKRALIHCDIERCVEKYRNQIILNYKIFNYMNKSIENVDLVSLPGFCIICILFVYCITTEGNGEYLDNGWCCINGILILSVIYLFMMFDQYNWVSCLA